MRTHVHTIVIIMATIFFLHPVAHGMNDTVEERFLQANQSYKAGNFQEAIQRYEELLPVTGGNGYVYFNLGNAYFKSNDLGKAIVNYERACVLLPRNADLDFNLRYARDQVKDAVTAPQDFIDMVFFWLDGFSPQEIFWAFAAINVFFWGIVLLRVFTKAEWSFYVLLTALGLWLVFGISFGLKWHQTENDHRAIIVAEEANVLAGPNKGDTLLFKLHAGTMVSFERSEEGWALIRLPDKKRGWVQKLAIDRISFSEHERQEEK